jgi:hypothetical protein
MSNQNRDYNVDGLNIKQKEKTGEDLIERGKAKFIDELVSVNELNNNLKSTLQQFSSLAPNNKQNVTGLGNLTRVNLGIVPEAFAIGSTLNAGQITAVDATGDIATYTNAKDMGSQQIKYIDPNASKENITVLRDFDLGMTNKLSCLSNGVYKESVASAGENIKWNTVTFEGAVTNAVDFTVFGSRHFFANKDGGILMTGGKSLTSTTSTDETKTVLPNIKFQALALDGPNKILFALDTTETGNNLLMFPLDKNLEFQFLDSDELETNFDNALGSSRVKFLVINIETSENYYFNNLIIAPGNKSNLINSGEYEVILVGTPLNNNNGEVNLFAGTIHYEGEYNSYPTCVFKNGEVYATCDADTVARWGFGATYSKEPFTWTAMPGKDFPGNDMAGNPPMGSSLDTCKAVCEADENCKGIVYGNHYGTPGNQCFKKSVMSQVKKPRLYESKDWCFLGGTVPSKRDYRWAQQQGRQGQSVEYYQKKCDDTPGCKGFSWRPGSSPGWYYTDNNFTQANNGGGWPGPGCQTGATGVPYSEACCHGFKVQSVINSSDTGLDIGESEAAGFTSYLKGGGQLTEDPFEVMKEKNIGNCNCAATDCTKRYNKNPRWGYCGIHSAPKLILTQLVDQNFSSKTLHDDNRYNIESPIYNLAYDAIEKTRKNSLGSVDYKFRYIPLDIDKTNNEIFILIDGVLLRHPLYGLGSRTNVETYRDLVNIPIDLIMNTIKKLSGQYDKINTTRNKLDTNLINNRNNILFKEMDLVTEKLNKLKNVEKEHRKLEGQVSSGEKFVTSNSLQYIFWSFLVIISIIIIGLHFINPNLIPTWGVIFYIIFCVIIVLVSRGIFTKVKNKVETIF